MVTFSLQSGSNGNSVYVEAGGTRLLFDAGISGRKAEQRMATHRRDIRRVDAVILSHDHRDHTACAGIYQRKYGLPIYTSPVTARAIKRHLGPVSDVRHFRAGEVLEIGEVTIHTIRTPHDALEGVVFIVEHEGKRLGIFTDLGHPFVGLLGLLESVDGAYLETNYDPQMLNEGPYPPHLKARIRGLGGHVSNVEAADLLRRSGRHRPQWIAMAHLSAENNRPELALATQKEAVGKGYPVYHASRYEVSPMLTL